MFNNLPSPGHLPEPTADIRGAAHKLAQIMSAYMESGFTREEAFELVSRVMIEHARAEREGE